MPGSQYSGKKRRFVTGCGADMYWTLDYNSIPQGVIATSEKDNTNANSKYVSEPAKMFLMAINCARSLWINGLVPGTLCWVDEDHFEAKADGPVEDNGADESKKVILGEITEKDSLNRPVKIKFICPALKGSPKFEHTYLYLSPVGKTKLPNLIVRRKDKFVGNDILTTFYTNTLVDIDIGISDLGLEGYVPGMFLESGKTNTAALQPMVVFIAKDGSRHIVEEGRSRKMPDNPITPDQLQLKPYRWKLLFACILLLIPILWKFIFLVIKNK